ncbi:hypothetical protein JCM10207_006974 [Rhodosporidiobolus poonsookiae]
MTATGWIDDVNIFAAGKTPAKAVRTLQARIPRAESWSRTHSSLFEPQKSTAVVFAPPGKDDLPAPPPLVLCGEAVPYEQSMTMLGAELDGRLSYEAHAARCAAKAATALSGVKTLLGACRGVPMGVAKTLVEAVVMPRLLWMSGVWWREGLSGSKVKVLRAVQRELARLVSGCYRTASLAAMEMEAGLPPLELRLALAQARLALRALSAAPSHPLAAPTRLAQATPHPVHPSALHAALASPLLPPLPRPLEAVLPDPLPPWTPARPVRVDVAESKAEAVEMHARLLAAAGKDDRVVYTDGSELEDGWTGAGVALRLGEADGELLWARKSVSLGQLQGVYAAELLAIQIAISLLPALFPDPDVPATLLVFADNTSALSAPSDPRPTSAQHLRLATGRILNNAARTHPLVSAKFGVHPTGLCNFCDELESRDHFLYTCPAYNTHRSALKRELGARALPPPSILLSTTGLVRPLLRFITATGRFPTLHQVVEDAKDAGEDAQARGTVPERATRVREEE